MRAFEGKVKTTGGDRVISSVNDWRPLEVSSRSPQLIVWSVYFFILSTPFAGISFWSIGGRGIARVDWVIAVFLLSVFISVGGGRIVVSRSSLYATFFVFTAFLGIFPLLDSSESQLVDFITKGAQLVFSFAIFLVISSLPLSEKELRGVLRIWLFVSVGVSLYAIYQVFARVYGLPLAYMELTNPSVTYGGGESRIIHGFYQVESVFREPSYLGAYLLGPIVLCTVFLLKGAGNSVLTGSRAANWTILCVLISAVLFTASQAAYLSLLVTVACMFFIGDVSRVKMTKIMLLLLAAFIGVGAFLELLDIGFLSAFSIRVKYLFLNIMDPAGTEEITSTRVRTGAILAALDVWASHPILGVGLNNMGHYNNEYEFSLGWWQLLADQGLLGTSALVLLFYSLLNALRNLYKKASSAPFWASVSLSLFFILVSDAVNGFFTWNWVDLSRWFTLALANLTIIRGSFHNFEENTGNIY